MGCDIHLAVEVRRNGRWERALPPEEARVPWLVEQAVQDPTVTWRQESARVEWYYGRNYELFAILAGVRNYEEIAPIAEPRGLPDDMSIEVARLDDGHPEHDGDSEDVWLGDHSQSWLTLAELQAYPWSERRVQRGVVQLHDFMQRCIAHGLGLPVEVDSAPYKTWCGDVFGPGIVTRDAAQIIEVIDRGGFIAPENERTHVRDQWSVPATSQCRDWCERVMPALARLGDPSDVRIVFGFDS